MVIKVCAQDRSRFLCLGCLTNNCEIFLILVNAFLV